MVRLLGRRLVLTALAALVLACSAHGQNISFLGRAVPTRSAAGLIQPSDVTFKGYYFIPSTSSPLDGDFTYTLGGFAMKKVSGKWRFFINTALEGCSGGAYACDGSPVEFEEPATFNSSGVCTSTSTTCPTLDMTGASGGFLIYKANWGINDDGSFTNFFHGVTSSYYDSGGTLHTDLQRYVWRATFTPNGDYLVSYGKYYGISEDYSGAALVTLDSNVAGVRTTTAYGPFIFQDTAGGAIGFQHLGYYAARYWTIMPDGSMGFGAGDSGATQQGNAPYGPNLMSKTAWPTTATSNAFASRITGDRRWLGYYNLTGYMNGITGPGGDTGDGTLPVGQPNWDFRFPFLWPYVYEGIGNNCQQGACSGLNPAANSGVGTWGESSHLYGMLVIKTATKQGAIAFASTSTNHLIGTNTTACSVGALPVAHNWYCSGLTSPPCAGVGPPPGDNLSPVYRCAALAQNTGPVVTAQEAMWSIFDYDGDMTAVKNGTKTDYTVNPTATIWPEIDYSLVMSTNNWLNIPNAAVPGVYDPATNLFYVLLPRAVLVGCCGYASMIGVFHVAQ